jgi:pyrrolysyl-tRNA synthetase-like protein
MSPSKPIKRYYRKQVDLFQLVQKLNLWPSRKGILHGIKYFRQNGDFAEITTHCNETFSVKNSRNSRSARWLRNKLFHTPCRECRVPEWKLEKYSLTYFHRRKGTKIRN